MAKQQALALALWDLGERAADSSALLLADEVARGTGELIFDRFFVGALEPADALQSGAAAPGLTQPIEGQVHPNPPQPGADLTVRLRLELLRVGELEKRFLQLVLRVPAVPHDAGHAPTQLDLDTTAHTA